MTLPLLLSDLEFLTGIRGILNSPAQWTQGRLARGAAGDVQPFNGSKATCWCVIGAGSKLLSYSGHGATEWPGDALARLLEIPAVEGETQRRHVSQFNDDPNTTFDMVAKVLDDAIARETAKLNPPAADSMAVAAPE